MKKTTDHQTNLANARAELLKELQAIGITVSLQKLDIFALQSLLNDIKKIKESVAK